MGFSVWKLLILVHFFKLAGKTVTSDAVQFKNDYHFEMSWHAALISRSNNLVDLHLTNIPKPPCSSLLILVISGLFF